MDEPAGTAHYVFRVTLRIDPVEAGVRLEPRTFQPTVFREAPLPGEDGWLCFRDTLWRGEVNAPDHLRETFEAAIGQPVERVEFRELRTDEAYLRLLKDAIADDLALFNADDVAEVLTKYLGSRIHVVE